MENEEQIGATQDLELEPPEEKSNETESLGDSEEDLLELLTDLHSEIAILGVGGAGNNLLSRVSKTFELNVETIGINTDAQDLFCTQCSRKFLIGKKVTYGKGTGNRPEKGKMAIEADIEKIRGHLNREVVILLTGLGGGTGGGASPIIAKTAKEQGATVLTLATLPFEMEGEHKRNRAYEALAELTSYSDFLLPLDNEQLRRLIPNLSLMEGFQIINEVVSQLLLALVEMIATCGLVNLDLADLKALGKNPLHNGTFIGIGQMMRETRAVELYENYSCKSRLEEIMEKKTLKILRAPLFDIPIGTVTNCLISITGNHELTVTEIHSIVDTIRQKITPDANLKFGLTVKPEFEKMRVFIIGTGDVSKHITRAQSLTKQKGNQNKRERKQEQNQQYTTHYRNPMDFSTRSAIGNYQQKSSFRAQAASAIAQAHQDHGQPDRKNNFLRSMRNRVLQRDIRKETGNQNSEFITSFREFTL